MGGRQTNRLEVKPSGELEDPRIGDGVDLPRSRVIWVGGVSMRTAMKTAKLFCKMLLMTAMTPIGNLKQYRGIAMDVGDQDGLRLDAGKLHDVFDKYGIANSFEIYAGTHTSAVADRFQNHVLPFFSKNLCFQASCQ
jgi:hypothetical protein